MKKSSIPVIYYHSVADHEKQHPWAFLSVRIGIFKSQMKLLKIFGYNTCNWREFYEHSQGIKSLPKKTVFIHFDDGFLDNWTVVYPIMEKYNFKYSVLITPDFVEKNNKVRTFVNKTSEENKDLWWGYLSEGEVIKMSESGLVDFQCHGFTHTWYESSDKILNFFNGKDFTPHLKWNLNPDDKPFWLKKYNEMHVPNGYPIFEFKKSLELNQVFYPNYKFINDCVLEVKNNGYDKEQLLSIYNLYKNKNNLGQFETKIQAKNRLYKELLETRDYIENLTGKDSSYIVFPGGGVNKEVRQFLKDNKFKLTSKGNQLNGFNTKLFQVSRLAGFVDLKLGGFINSLANIPLLYLQILRGQGKYFLNKLIKR